MFCRSALAQSRKQIPVEFSNPDAIVQLKPMRSFLSNLQNRLKARLAERSAVAAPVIPEKPVSVVVAGAGAAGIEIACGLCSFLEHQNIRHYRIIIVTASDEILPGVSPGLRKRVQSFLAKKYRRFEVITASRIHRTDSSSVHSKSVQLNTGQILNCDLIVWATEPRLRRSSLNWVWPVDERGFLLTDAALKSTSGHPIFAVGDSGTIDELRLPKAGVFAVRQGPSSGKISTSFCRIDHSSRTFAVIVHEIAEPWRRHCSGEWKGFSFSGKWTMRLKNRIDHHFVQMYQQFMPNQMTDQEQCRGCGCKLGSHLLQEALHKVDQLDDAAVIGIAARRRVIASTISLRLRSATTGSAEESPHNMQ